MSLFGSIMGDFDDDPFFGAHMRSMRQMNNMMNSLFADPFAMMHGFGMGGPPALTMGNMANMANRNSMNSMMPYGFPAMPQMNMNRLLSGSLDSGLPDSHSFSSSSMVSLSMSSGPDGRPQVVQASSSTRTGPGGIRETKRTMSDSRSGTKKMAIGHHIGDRAHVIEREQNVRSGDQEERQEFINLEEEEAEDFNREFETRARPYRRHPGGHTPQLALPSTAGGSPNSLGARHPYAISHPASRRPLRPMKSVSGHSAAHDQQHQSPHHQLEDQQTHEILDDDDSDEQPYVPQPHAQINPQKYTDYQ